VTNKQLHTLCGVILMCGGAIANSLPLVVTALGFFICSILEKDKNYD
jgi:hypothetical protein